MKKKPRTESLRTKGRRSSSGPAPITHAALLESAAKQLRADFEALRREVPHRGLRGSEVEAIVRTFLVEHIPRRFDVGSGFILDSRDARSKQTDIIVYDALNCPRYRVSENASIYPANNVAAVVEVKSRLDGRSLADAFRNIQATKSLAKTRPRETGVPFITQTHGSIFAFESALSLPSIKDAFSEWIRANGIGAHPDMVCVLDRGVVTTVAGVPGLGWNTAIIEALGAQPEGASFGVGTLEFGKATLDGWLRLLLAHLINFRAVVDHRGFDWSHLLTRGMPVTYLGSVTHEKDPTRRDARLREYHARFVSESSDEAHRS